MSETTAQEFPVVPPLHWTEELQLNDERMDKTHEEFVAMLADLRSLPFRDQLPLYRELIRHTEEHFAQEERWMVTIGFTADNCHASQHNGILDTMRQVETHFLQGDMEIIDRMAAALAEWFPMHAASMDAGLAQHMKNVKFDSKTETLEDPSLVRPATMSGCGSVSCS